MKKLLQIFAVSLLLGQPLIYNGTAVYAAEQDDTAQTELKDATSQTTTTTQEAAPNQTTATTAAAAADDADQAAEPSAAVQTLIQQIAELDLDQLTSADQEKINQLINTYNQFTTEEKNQVTNADRLTTAAAQLQQLVDHKEQLVDKTITLSVEKFVLGQGYIVEPVQVHLTQDMSYAAILDEVFAEQGIQYTHTGNTTNGFYLSGISNADNGQTKIPQVLVDFGANYGIALDDASNANFPTLQEFSYSGMAGWMYSVNNVFPGVGMSDRQAADGDVFRVQFSIVGFGADLGTGYGGSEVLTTADKTALTKRIAEINQDAAAWQSQGVAYQQAYQYAKAQLEDLTAPQTNVDQALQVLNDPTNQPEPEPDPAAQVKALIEALGVITDLSQKAQVVAARAAYEALTATEKAMIGADLLAVLTAAEQTISELEDQAAATNVIELINALPAIADLQLTDKARVDAAQAAFETLSAAQQQLVTNLDKLQAAISKLQSLDQGLNLDTAMKTAADRLNEYTNLNEWRYLAQARSGYPASEASRLVSYKALAKQILDDPDSYGRGRPWTDAERQAIGILSLGGDPANISGVNLIQLLVDNELTGTINNQIFGLIVLSSKEYEVEGRAAKLDQLIERLLGGQLMDGGWALYGNVGDIDVTGMALTALAPFKDQAKVAAAIDKGIIFLKRNMTNDADFFIASSYSDAPNANSQAQAILGLAACGEDLTSADYTKKGGKNPISRLLDFQIANGGFKRYLTDATDDMMATDQAVHGLSQFIFQQENRGVIYDFDKNPVELLPLDDDATAAQKVAELIEALPAPETLTLEDRTAVQTAASEYQLLTEAAKALVSAELRQKLTACQQQIAQLENEQQAVASVIQKLEYMQLIDQMNLWSLSYKTYVINTRTEYEALSAAQKALIKPDLIKSLEKAETIMAQLEQEEKDLQAITAAITALPEAAQLTLKDEAQVAAVETQYNELTDPVKKRIDKTLVEKLTAILERMKALKEDAAQAYKVDQQIAALPKPVDLSLADRGKVEAARADYDQLTKAQQALVKNYQALTAAEKRITELMAQQAAYTEILKETNGYVAGLFNHYEPTFTNEWLIMDLARNGYDLNSELFKTYYENVVAYLRSVNGNLHSAKYTEYSRLALALTAIGKDARDVSGYNLFDALSDFKKVTYQGINGAIFALIAVDTRQEYAFTQPAGVSEYTTREKLIAHILEHELAAGGWTLYGNTLSIDITAMALQALAPYRADAKVAAAIERGLTALSKQQNATGTFGTTATENSEEIAQVITALTALGINPTEDKRFVKEHNLIEALSSFHVKGLGFVHVLPGGNSNGGGAPGEVNGMATEQAMYALVAYDRFLNQQTALYDMNDVPTESDQAAALRVTNQINALGTITSLKQKSLVSAARNAYEGLTQKQQTMVAQAVYDKLVQSEKQIADLEAAASEAALQATADKVSQEIADLPAPAAISEQDEGQILLVRQHFNSLSKAAQQLVKNLGKLELAEQSLQALKQAAANEASGNTDTGLVLNPVTGGGPGTGNLTVIGGSQTNNTGSRAPIASVSSNPAAKTAAKAPAKTAKNTGWTFAGDEYQPAQSQAKGKKDQAKSPAPAPTAKIIEIGGIAAAGTALAAAGFWFLKKRA